MEPIQEVRRLLKALSRGGKAQVEMGDDFPGIGYAPNVCGGDPCVASLARTRIPVWLLERYRRLGVTERDLLDSYPSLRRTSQPDKQGRLGI